MAGGNGTGGNGKEPLTVVFVGAGCRRRPTVLSTIRISGSRRGLDDERGTWMQNTFTAMVRRVERITGCSFQHKLSSCPIARP